MKLACFPVLLLIALLVTPAGAQYPSCVSSRVIYSSPVVHSAPFHHEKVVAAPIITPVVPQAVFQFVPVLTLPQALGYGSAAPANYGAPVGTTPVAAAANPKCLDEAAVARIVAEKIKAAGIGGPPPIPGRQTTVPQSTPATPVMPQAEAAPKGEDNAWVQSLGKNCYECHNTNKKSGGVSLFTLNDKGEANFEPTVSDAQINESIKSGRMPKEKQLSATDRDLILGRPARPRQ
jgi:hypothetical protein